MLEETSPAILRVCSKTSESLFIKTFSVAINAAFFIVVPCIVIFFAAFKADVSITFAFNVISFVAEREFAVIFVIPVSKIEPSVKGSDFPAIAAPLIVISSPSILRLFPVVTVFAKLAFPLIVKSFPTSTDFSVLSKAAFPVIFRFSPAFTASLKTDSPVITRFFPTSTV